jgi:hypothetical protein
MKPVRHWVHARRCGCIPHTTHDDLTTCLFKLMYYLDKLLKLRIYIPFAVGAVLLPGASVTINPNVRGGSLGGGSQPFPKLGRRRACCLVVSVHRGVAR